MTSIRTVIGLGTILVAIVSIGLLISIGWHALENPGSLAMELISSADSAADSSDRTPRTFVVREGETTAEIASRLESAGLVSHGMLFRLLAEGEGLASDLAAGEYELYPAMRPSEILAIFSAGRTRPGPMVTIPEGWRSEEIAERLASRGIAPAGRFLEVVRRGRSDLPALSSRPAGASLEGYLFPDTYSYDPRTDAESMAERMVRQFDQRFTAEMWERSAALGMSVHQVVTLASIIEREAVLPDERQLMAGVFYNRLREGIPLQTDPTVQFAVATADPESQKRYGWWKSSLTPQDLAVDSPYNTYGHPGLPPGPICSPGLASLRAAVEPAVTDYLYFVARPDGSHAFARTLQEHNENVSRYRSNE